MAFFIVMKKSFLLYCDLKHTIDKLPDETAGRLLKLILDYANGDFNQPTDLLLQVVFEPIKQSLIRDLEKYDAKVIRNKENGSKGGRPSKENNPQKPTGLNNNPLKAKKADSDSDSDIVSDIGNEREIVKIKKDKEPKSINDFVKLMESEKYLGTDENLNKTFINFIQMRISIKKTPTKNAVELLVKKLRDLSKANKDVAVKILEKSIENNWIGIFELKTNNTTNFIKQVPAVFNRSSQGQKYVGDDVI
jgi:hypothetical protein